MVFFHTLTFAPGLFKPKDDGMFTEQLLVADELSVIEPINKQTECFSSGIMYFL